MRSAYAQQKDYFDFGVRERLRAFLDPIFTAGVVVAVQVLLSAVAVKEKLPYKTKKTAIKSCLSCGAPRALISELFSAFTASPKATVSVPSL